MAKMKNLKLRFIMLYIFGGLFVLGGILTSISSSPGEKSTYMISTGIAIIIVGTLALRRRMKLPEPDERDIKLNRASLSYSWFFTYLIVAVLVLVDYFKLIFFTAQQVLGIVFFSMIMIQLISKMYLYKKGDVN